METIKLSAGTETAALRTVTDVNEPPTRRRHQSKDPLASRNPFADPQAMAIVAAAHLSPCPYALTRSFTRRGDWGLLCAAGILLCNAEAIAQTDSASAPVAAPATAPAAPMVEEKKKAAAHFETGMKLYEDGDYALSLIEFERAYSYVADYRVLFNIGQVSGQLGRYARAVQALRQYLELGGSNLAPARVASVQEDLKMMEGRTARLQIDCNVEGVEVLLNDVRLGYTPMDAPQLVDAGEHRLTLQKPGYTTRTERLVLAGRDESRLKYDLVGIQVPVVPIAQPTRIVQPPPKTEAPKIAKSTSTRTQLLYAGAGSTGVFAVAWAATGYVGIKAVSDLRDALQRPTSQGELDSYKSRARGAFIASDILGAAALITGGTTLFFALKGPSRDPHKTSATRVDVGLAPSAVLVTGAF